MSSVVISGNTSGSITLNAPAVAGTTTLNLPATTGTVLNDATCGVCRAWVNFNGTGTVAIRASFNVSSITDNGTGDYTANFTTALSDANYSVVGISNNSASNSFLYVVVLNGAVAQTTSTVRFFNKRGGDHVNSDNSIVNIAVFR